MLVRIFVNIVLLIIYCYIFGQYSIRKYLDKGVITIKQQDESSNIPAPSNVDIGSDEKTKISQFHSH